ncbi:serine/threonine-protein kinase haspin-like [Centruroides sculpturatus]|uniref:serine/threonine-protein kinase haspin-like n=1 Tax=Centruroides sculpturatus TaxID=218467 RepID=UPI000C6D4850|nr:serine/threonine-protein kinase haspin-like [Centruroides sculpturatus]
MSAVKKRRITKRRQFEIMQSILHEIIIYRIQTWWRRQIKAEILRQAIRQWRAALIVKKCYLQYLSRLIRQRKSLFAALISQFWFKKQKIQAEKHLIKLQRQWRAINIRKKFVQFRLNSILAQAGIRRYLIRKDVNMRTWIVKHFSSSIWLSTLKGYSEELDRQMGLNDFLKQMDERNDKWGETNDTHISEISISTEVRDKTIDQLTLCNLTDPTNKYYKLVLAACEQTSVIPFFNVFPKRNYRQYWRKIGEGSYGDVYAMMDEYGIPHQLYKIVPIGGFHPLTGKALENLDTVYPEIISSIVLSSLSSNEINRTSGFTQVSKVSCVSGPIPEYLRTARKMYNLRKKSTTKCPNEFPDDQIFIVYKMKYAGQQITSFSEFRVEQASSVLQQVACSIAAAELEVKFEHRDLHLGNVLIKKTAQSSISFRLDGRNINIASHGVLATIIDYTFSRLNYGNKVIFRDLSCHLFDRIQTEHKIYRKMRQYNQNNWGVFWPYSNVMWLWYLNACLIKDLEERPIPDSVDKQLEDLSWSQLSHWKKNILSRDSVANFVLQGMI